jgi:aromatic-amino-acid transaminase
MFAFTPLSKEQVIKLRNDFGVYMLENGRISLSGINTKNVHHIAKSIASVLKPVSK